MLLRRLLPAALGLCLGVGVPRAARAQETPAGAPAAEALRVFLDCNTFCDTEFIRREITYVNWVRDRQDADVHLIITSQSTGGGGREYRLRYLGLRAFRGADDELTFTTRQSDTDDEIRRQQTQRIGLGLARYVARGSNADRLRLTFSAPESTGVAPAQQPHDPWNLWVFRLGMNGFFSGESQAKQSNISGSARASRVSEAWKFSLSMSANRRHSNITLSDSSVFKSTTSRYSAGLLLARSMGDHWSLGLQGSVLRSTIENYDLNVQLTPEVEYDVFPYKESSRRQFVLVYAAGLTYSNYQDTTIFDKLRETLPSHSFTAAAEAVQPWGNLDGRLVLSSLLNDFTKNRISIFGSCEIRLIRGLNLNVGGGYSRVRDQLSLLKTGLSDEDILLRLKQLKTSYFYNGFVGLSYNFGSKFNNVVNPRFTHSGGGGGNCECFGGSCFCN
jgi:hypothetical protein